MTEYLQRNPAYEKGQGRPLPARGAPLANLTTVKLSRNKVRKLQAESVWKVCFSRFIQSSIYPPWPNPQGMHLTCTIPRHWLCCADLKLSSQGWWSVGMIWSGGLVWWWRSDLIVWWLSGLRMAWSGADLVDWCGGLVWCGGLIWRSVWGKWSGMSAENWKDDKPS